MRVCYGGAILLMGCAPLSAPSSQVCGNGIVEPDAAEDCDGSEECIPADQSHACSWSCGPPDGCPRGACGLDGVCRTPALRLESDATTVEAASVFWLQAHDMDADGRADLVWARRTVDSTGLSRTIVELVGFDSARQATGAFSWDGSGPGVEWVGPPTVSDQNSDGLLDMLVATGQDGGAGLTLLTNAGDQTFVPAPAASAWSDRGQIDDLGFTPWAYVDGGIQNLGGPVGLRDGRFVSVLQTGTLAVGPFPIDGEDHYAWNPRFVDGVCAGHNRLAALAEGDGIVVSAAAGVCIGVSGERTLQVPGAVDAWVRMLDVNGDGALDVLARSSEDEWSALYVAYGVEDGSFHSDAMDVPAEDGDDAFAPAPLFEFAAPGATPPRILEVALLDGDLVPDFLAQTTDPGIVVGRSGVPCGAGTGWACGCTALHACAQLPEPIAATGASVSDVSGDGERDIVVVGDSGVHWWLADGDTFRSASVTNPPGTEIEDLELGDLDGDAVTDVLLARRDRATGLAEVMVSWGGVNPPQFERLGEMMLQGGLVVGQDATYPGLGRDELFTLALDTGDRQRTGLVRFDLAERQWRPRVPVPNCSVSSGETGIVALERGDFLGDGARVAWATAEGAVCLIGLRREPAGVIHVADSREDQPSFAMDTVWNWVSGAVAEDFDGDGLEELVLVGAATEATSEGPGTLLGAVDFQQPELPPTLSLIEGVEPYRGEPGGGGERPTVVDVDGDGDLDLFVLVESPVGLQGRVLFSRGNGSFFGESLLVDGEEAVGVRFFVPLGPSEVDGLPVAMVMQTPEGGSSVHTGLLAGAEFTSWSVRAVPSASAVAGGDFDGDGLGDVAIAGDPIQVLWGERGYRPLEDGP